VHPSSKRGQAVQPGWHGPTIELHWLPDDVAMQYCMKIALYYVMMFHC